MNYTFILRIYFSWLLLSVSLSTLQAQDSTSKSSIIVDISYHQTDADAPVIKAVTKTKVNKKFKPVGGVVVNFFMNEESSAGYVGSTTTDVQGVGAISLPTRAREVWDTLNTFVFIATVTGNNQFEDTSSEIEITKARIELSLQEEDSIRTISAKIFSKQDSSWVVVSDTELKFVVNRYFNDLPISEDVFTTNEDGELATEYGLTLPGDENGYIILGAKLEDHEVFGNLTATRKGQWGVPQAPDNSFAKRTLFATRDKTPWWLLIFPNLIIISVWTIIIYLIYQISQIRKIGKAN